MLLFRFLRRLKCQRMYYKCDTSYKCVGSQNVNSYQFLKKYKWTIWFEGNAVLIFTKMNYDS